MLSVMVKIAALHLTGMAWYMRNMWKIQNRILIMIISDFKSMNCITKSEWAKD